MYKNVANQKVAVFAWDTVNGAEKTGDVANITAQISKDGGACVASNDINPTELDATNAPGIYLFDLTQAETNCDLFILFAKNSTANIKIEPVVAYLEQQYREANVIQIEGSDATDQINAACDVAIADAALDKAAKILKNKAVQNKATGTIEYYDDDGQTVILTHTPTDGESEITRMPS